MRLGAKTERRNQAKERRAAPRIAVVMVRVWAVIVTLSVLPYLLPLSASTMASIGEVSYNVSAAALTFTLIRAVFVVSGVDRLAWLMLALTSGLNLVLVVIDPVRDDGTLNSSQWTSPLVGLVFAAIVVLIGRRGITRLGVARLVVDGIWLTVGVMTAAWFWTITPVSDIGGTTPHAVAVLGSSALSVVVALLLFVRVSGPDQLAFAALGTGAMLSGVAMLLNIRFTYEQSLQTGAWYDLLWVLGFSMLGYATLYPDVGSRLRHHRLSSVSEQFITAIPVVALLIPLLSGEAWERTPSIAVVAMVVVLAIRVVLLISQNETLSDRLTDMAHRDELTGLLNRRALLEIIARQEETVGSRSHYSVLYLDLDGFKLVNDTWGHAAGDQVLAATAQRLRDSVRVDDVVARLGGDEFVVVAVDSDAEELARRLVAILAEPVEWAGEQLDVGCSVGVANSSPGCRIDVLAAADAALYDAKAMGRGRYEVAPEAVTADVAGT